MIQCISAKNRTELDRSILERLLEHVDDAGVCRFLYLSPTKRKCRDMATKFQEQRRVWNPRFLVPKELAEELVTSQLTWRNRPISDELKALLIRNILYTTDSEESFSKFRFKSSPTPLGIARHVAAALDDLARRDLAPDDKRAGVRPELEYVLSQVQSIYSNELNRLSLYDLVHLPKLAIQALSEANPQWSRSINLLVLDGFVAPDPIESRFLLELALTNEDLSILVTLPNAIVEHVKDHGWKAFPTDLRLYQFGELLFQGLEIEQVVDHLGNDQFGIDKPPVQKTSLLTSYPDLASEVQGIARTIKKLYFQDHNNELSAEDFHILVPRIEPYYQLFVEIFPRYGIPFNITRGTPLSSLPTTRIIVALLDAIMIQDRSTLFEFFSSELVTVAPVDSPDGLTTFLQKYRSILDDCSVQIDYTRIEDFFPTPSTENIILDIWALDRLCRNLGFSGGHDFSQHWLQPAVDRMNGLFSTARRSQNRLEDERLARDFLSILVQLWLLEREFKAFDQVLASQQTSLVVELFIGLLHRYEVQINLVKSLTTMELSANTDRGIMIEKNVQGFKEALNVLRDVASDLEIVGRGSVGIEAIRELFLDRCTRVMIQEAGALSGVSISQMLEIRNISPQVVFAAGLTADDFPVTPGNNFILSRSSDSEPFIKALAEGRFILSQMQETLRKVFLSYPESDGTDPLEMSQLLQDLVHQGALTVPDTSTESGEQYAPFEVLREAGRAWSENEPVPWDHIAHLIAQKPMKSEYITEELQQHFRTTFLSLVERNRMDRLGLYDGLVQDQSVLNSINDLLDTESYSYSISMLNDYLRCPMQFFFKRMLGLEPLEEVPEELEAAEFGSAVHEILAEFYRAWRKLGQGRIRPENRIDALPVMLEISDSVLTGFRFMEGDQIDSAAAHSRITRGLYTRDKLRDETLRANIERDQDLPRYRKGLLRMLADYEASLDLPFYPMAEEFGFGFDDGPLLVLPGKDGKPVRIRGKIDRIDIYGTQSVDDAEYAWIFDYKTGKCPTMKSVREGMDLQLPVYILALKHGVSPFKGNQVGACFVSLRQNEEALRKRILYLGGFTDEMLRIEGRDCWKLEEHDLEMFRSWIVEIDSSIRRGSFPRSMDSTACLYCDYVSACFREEYRVTQLTHS